MSNARKKIRIQFVDFPRGFNVQSNIIYQQLNDRYEVELSKTPDYIFFSTEGYQHLSYDCIRIQVCSEEIPPDFLRADYVLGHYDLTFGDRYLLYPRHAKDEDAARQKLRDFLFAIFDRDLSTACRRSKVPFSSKFEKTISEGDSADRGQISPVSRLNVIRQAANTYLVRDKGYYDFKGIKIPENFFRLDSFIDIFYPHVLGLSYSMAEGETYYSEMKRWYPELSYLGDRYTKAGWIDWNRCRANTLLPLHGSFYFNDHATIQKGDVVFDIGAAPGDFTSAALTMGASKVFACEPSDEGVKKLKQTMSLTGQFDIIDRFIGSSTAPEKRTISIDDLVREHGLEKVDFIKMDVEGMEKDVLQGAENTLKRMSPKMVICTYHKQEDKITLPEFVLKLNPDYKVVHGRSVIYCFTERNIPKPNEYHVTSVSNH